MNDVSGGLLSPAKMAGDIDQVSTLYERIHPLATKDFPVRSPLEELSRLKQELVSPLLRIGFYRVLAPVLNGTGDEHSHLMLPAADMVTHATSGGLFFPYDVAIIDDRAFVSSITDGDNTSDSPVPPGAELVSIDSRPVAEVIATLRGFFSGTSDMQKNYFHSRLEVLIPASINHGHGVGPVQPDRAVRVSRQDIAKGRDPVMENALDFLGEV